jgi:hypothetical protein
MGISSFEAVVLAADPAKHTSGAALLIPDYGPMDEPHDFRGDYVLYEFGRVERQAERKRYIEQLLDLSDEFGIPPVFVAETWDPPHDKRVRLANGGFALVKDQKWTYKTILGIGEGWGRWSAEVEAANEFREEEGQPPIIVERVLPDPWRDKVFGERRPRDTASSKATAQRYFTGVFGYETATSDVAEAGCIGVYAITSETIAQLVREYPAAKQKRKKKR